MRIKSDRCCALNGTAVKRRSLTVKAPFRSREQDIEQIHRSRPSDPVDPVSTETQRLERAANSDNSNYERPPMRLTVQGKHYIVACQGQSSE
jgi:hypothetical protein